MTARVEIVVPARNEARFIAATLASLMPRSDWPFEWSLVVMNGGSTDDTVAETMRFAARSPHGDRISIRDNPGRTQPAAVNLAAETAEAKGCDVLVQCDAHGLYPEDFVARVVAKLETTGADSVVIGMDSRSHDGRWFSVAAAAAQNSKLGNGGSAHRDGASSRFVDHGHHAAFDLKTFRALGGYDESFRTNFDAEYDMRMAKAGKRVFLDAEDSFVYFVRDDASSLARQYFGHGSGRAMTVLKHRRIKPRQVAPAMVTALNGLCLLAAPAFPAALLVPAAYACACMAVGATASGAKGAQRLAGIPAMIAHHAWGIGFLTSGARQLTPPGALRFLDGLSRRAIP